MVVGRDVYHLREFQIKTHQLEFFISGREQPRITLHGEQSPIVQWAVF
jgi:hypothetical protein